MLGRQKTALFAMVALTCGGCATGSVVRSPCVHVGVRPAADMSQGAAVTVQVSADTPALLGPSCRAQ
jgi:hypothetical protein